MSQKYLNSFLFAVVLALPACKPKVSAEAQRQHDGFRALQMAMFSAQLDATTTGDNSTGYPLEAKHSSVADVRRMLNDKGYLELEDQKLIDFGNVRIGNVSESDPSEVVLLITREPIDGRIVFLRKGGDGGILEASSDKIKTELKDPPRSPAYLD